MDTVLQIFLRGLAVGLFVSAPMGPVGILCIQRTLNKGRLTGFYTGVGAAASDFIYCLLTGFGLAFIEDFLQRNQNWIQLVGSVVLIGFAVYLFRKNPSAGLRKPGVEAGSPGKDILGGFLFTFSNPLILFLIIGLFARFNFLAPDHTYYHYIVGYIAIVAGALGWWWLVTYFVNKLRAHFNVRSMWLINRCIGILIMIFGIVGIVTSVGSLAGWAQNATAPVCKDMDNETAHSFSMNVADPYEIYFRTSATRTGRHNWQLTASDSTDTVFRLHVSKCLRKEADDPIYNPARSSAPALRIALTEGNSEYSMIDTVVCEGFNALKGINAWQLTRSGNKWTLWGGETTARKLGIFKLPSFNLQSLVFAPLDETGLTVSALRARGSAVTDLPTTDYDCQTDIGLEGEWMVYDYDMETGKLQLGGKYLLQFSYSDAGYKAAYISGAEYFPGSWHEGRLKALLAPSPFPGIFNIVWIDVHGDPVEGATASYSAEEGMLTIHFPKRNSQLRLRKIG